MPASPFARSSSYDQVALHDDEDEDILINVYIDKSSISNSDKPIERQESETMVFEIGELDDDEFDDDDIEEQPQTQTQMQQERDNPHAPPHNYVCPLTLQIMEDPVMDGCGHCFDRAAIVGWLDYHEFCPISRKPLHFQNLHAATPLNDRIRQWKAEHRYEHNNHNQQDQTGMLSISESGSQYSQLELMLLPQERKVLHIIQLRARDRRKRQAYSRCMWSFAGAMALLILVATCLALKFFDVRFKGPLL
jgi:hypothetical protein